MEFSLKHYLYNVQDWPRHRKECVPAQSYSIATAVPPPTEQHPNMIIVSAIFLSPEEGMCYPCRLLHFGSHLPQNDLG